MGPRPPISDALVMRARHGASSRTRWLRSFKRPYSVMPGAFEIGFREGFLGMLYPTAVIVLGACVFGHIEALLVGLIVVGLMAVPAGLTGAFIARHLSRFAFVDSRRRLALQGLILGAAAALPLLAPFVRARFFGDTIALAAYLLACGALAGYRAGRGIGGWSGL